MGNGRLNIQQSEKITEKLLKNGRQHFELVQGVTFGPANIFVRPLKTLLFDYLNKYCYVLIYKKIILTKDIKLQIHIINIYIKAVPNKYWPSFGC